MNVNVTLITIPYYAFVWSLEIYLKVPRDSKANIVYNIRYDLSSGHSDSASLIGGKVLLVFAIIRHHFSIDRKYRFLRRDCGSASK